MKFLCLSDLHGHLPDLSGHDADFVLLAGDWSPHVRNDAKWARWMDVKLRDWLERAPAQVIAIPGNHDTIAERCPHLVPELPWILLDDRTCAAAGYLVEGSPWSLPAPHPLLPRSPFAYQAPEMLLEKRWASLGFSGKMPVDILLTHCPPSGCGSVANGVDIGSPSLRRWVEANQPRLVVCGHCHGGYGTYQMGETIVVNAALCDDDNEIVRGPIVVEIDKLEAGGGAR